MTREEKPKNLVAKSVASGHVNQSQCLHVNDARSPPGPLHNVFTLVKVGI